MHLTNEQDLISNVASHVVTAPIHTAGAVVRLSVTAPC
jgi:hypothetical protein